MSLAQAERHHLADLLLTVGPDAPTLCEGWTTADLAAHLVVRERHPTAALGMGLSPLASHLENTMERVKAGGYAASVELVRNGPPALLRAVDPAMNTSEFYIHHEDVRRAQPDWEPRTFDAADRAALWRSARQLASFAVRGHSGGLVFVVPDGPRAKVRAGSPVTVVTGEPGELLLWMTGRREHARVQVS